MEIQIPSPSVFLKKSPPAAAAPASNSLPAKKPAKSKSNATTKSTTQTKGDANTVQDGAITKPKQSKSRNGCMTCKKKRLKCDETKPSCVQCQKRNVVCEGYKKDYKWRSFEETNFVPKPPAKPKNVVRATSDNVIDVAPQPSRIDPVEHRPIRSSDGSSVPNSWSPGLSSAFASATHAFNGSASPEREGIRQEPSRPRSSPTSAPVPVHESNDRNHPPLLPEGLVPFPNNTRSSSNNGTRSPNSPISNFSGSPRLIDLLLPGTDLNQPPDPSEMRPPMSPLPYQPSLSDAPPDLSDVMPLVDAMPLDDDFDEEVIREHFARQAHSDVKNWALPPNSPAASDISLSSQVSGLTILGRPRLDEASLEQILVRFDAQTCGILSVKDGPTENPWRTLIWPLAQNSPALYHAMISMTAFHGARDARQLHFLGVHHMNRSIQNLLPEVDNVEVVDSPLATMLTLAFSEGWDRHVSTGIQHLQGASGMVKKALTKYCNQRPSGLMGNREASRIKFLCNTFVYMAVIARLTSQQEATSANLEDILSIVNQPSGDLLEIDPLMGCATTLFPLVGRVADLIQKCRQTQTNSLNLVSRANELKEQLQQWQVPNPLLFERPEDASSEVTHSVQTAEAYRWATLLYLHQAVPEIPSEPALDLAKKVLMLLASVPLSSRTTIVQIFPLFAASCEITDPEDRHWVIDRWVAMMLRLKIGNVDSCWNVIQEVWKRRDQFEAEKADRILQRYNSRGVPNGGFVPPMLKHKRKVHSNELMNEEAMFDAFGSHDDLDHNPRSFKRRVTFDTMANSGRMHGPGAMGMPNMSRRPDDIGPNQIEPEYTVRGRLHWLGVMEDWQWEVLNHAAWASMDWLR